MYERLWVQSKDAIAIHERQIVEHGGLPGIKDEGLLESAIARPNMCWPTESLTCPTSRRLTPLRSPRTIPSSTGKTHFASRLPRLFRHQWFRIAGRGRREHFDWGGAGRWHDERSATRELRTRVRIVINGISGEGGTVQSELIEDTPVPVAR